MKELENTNIIDNISESKKIEIDSSLMEKILKLKTKKMKKKRVKM